jgi:hypothetical protein
MSVNIEGGKLARAREIVRRRLKKDEVIMAISDAGIADPDIVKDEYEPWIHETLTTINRTRKLDKLLETLASRIADGDETDRDANELLEIVKSARAAMEAAKAPIIVEPEREPTPKPEPTNGTNVAKPEPTNGTNVAIKVGEALSGSTQPPPPVTGIVLRHTKRTRVVLLGEALAYSADNVGESRKKAFAQLTDALQPKGITVVDWGDRWNARESRVAAEPADAEALFVRVVNEEILDQDLEQLLPLPQKLALKLKLPKSIDGSQVVIWNCEGGPPRATTAPSGGQEDSSRAEIKKRLKQENLLLAEEPIEQLVTFVRSRLGFERLPPSLRLEHPGNNTLIEDKLINVIMLSTKDKCQPPFPQMVYLEVTTGSDGLAAELKDMVSDEIARDGVIIAIHDLNLNLTDDRNEALWAFQDRLAEYDKLLAEIMERKGIPKTKVVKLAIIMAAANKLVKGRYPYSYLHRDWIIVGMRKDNETAILEKADESLIKTKIDALVGIA